MTEDPPLYRESREHLLIEPRHQLRAEQYPRRPSDLYQESSVDQRNPEPIPSSRAVYDPTIGRDGGGGYGSESLPPPVDLDRYVPVPPSAPEPAPVELVGCPRCGTGVHPDRIRD